MKTKRTSQAQTKGRERRKWALDMAAALLHSDMDCFDSGFDEDEDEKRQAAIRQIADELKRKADRIS